MPKANIEPADLQVLTQQHNNYLADDDGMITSAMQLQDDAYHLGYQRAANDAKVGEMQRLLAQINKAHGSGLPKATRKRIVELLSA